MAITAINNDEELLKRLKEQGLYDGGQTSISPGQQNGVGDTSLSFEDQYNTNNVFGVDPNKRQGGTTSTSYQTMGAQAGSSANPVTTPNNSTGQVFSLSDALQMDNLPTTPTVTTVQAPIVSSALTATSSTDKNNGSGDYKASHNALLASLSWTGTETIDNSSPTQTTGEAGEVGGAENTGNTGNAGETGDAGNINNTGETGEAGNTGETGGTDNTGGTQNPSTTENPSDNKGDNGAGEGGADGSGKTAEQLAQEEAEKQAQILLEQQQQKILEEQQKQLK